MDPRQTFIIQVLLFIVEINNTCHIPYFDFFIYSFFCRGSILLGPEGADPQLCEVTQQEQQEERSSGAADATPQEQVGRKRVGWGPTGGEPVQPTPAPVLVAQ